MIFPVSLRRSLAVSTIAVLCSLAACAAVKDTGQLLYKDTATDSFDGRYPGFNQFLNRVSRQCDGYPVGDANMSTLIGTDSNMIDALSRLYEAKITPADFSAFLGGWYAGTDTRALASCIFAQLPSQPKP
ncbi:MAG: hypothetical protein ABWY07_04325 [Burkholderiales bacterium]